MTQFYYNAISSEGEKISGFHEAGTEDAVILYIRSQGWLPVDVEEKQSKAWWSYDVADVFGKKNNPQVLSHFTDQLARLLKAGLELDRAIQLLGELEENKKWSEVVSQIERDVRQGSSLAASMQAQETIFPKDYVSLICAGEASGTLSETLEQLSSLIKRRIKIKQKVVSALIYPALLMIVAVCAIIIMLTFVLPQFEPLFADAGTTMPWPTRFVIFISNVIQGFWWLWVLLIGMAFGTLRFIQKTPHLLLKMDRKMLAVPLLGSLLLRSEVARLSRTIGTLLHNGVVLGEAVKLSAEGITNQFIRKIINDASVSIREGRGLAASLSQSNCFPKLMMNMIQIGEESGRLDNMLIEVADVYEDETQRVIDRILAMLVPGLTIFMGLIIAFIVASMLLAMLSINELAI